MAHWREGISPEIKGHFERLVSESAKHKETYEKAKDQALAQLWTANAIQEKKLSEMQAKIDLLERAIKVLAGKGKVAEQAALKANFLEKALAEISGGKKEKEVPGIDANKAMREVISRPPVEKQPEEEPDDEDEEEDDEEDSEPEEEAESIETGEEAPAQKSEKKPAVKKEAKSLKKALSKL